MTILLNFFGGDNLMIFIVDTPYPYHPTLTTLTPQKLRYNHYSSAGWGSVPSQT